MAYIGNAPANRFVAPKAASVFSGDGSDTTFTLDHAVGSDEDILVSVDGVIQEPSVAYAVSNGTTLTFTAAPSSNSGNNIFVYYLFRTVGTVGHPSNQALTATTGTFSDNVTLTGTTPTLTIGDAGAEDTKIVFDGNAQDFHIGLDDSADSLTIGLGSALGTTSHMIFDANGHITKPLQSAFMVRSNQTQSNFTTGSFVTVDFHSERFDQNSDFDNTNMVFTAPVTGRYQFNILITPLEMDSAASYFQVIFDASNVVLQAGLVDSDTVLNSDSAYYMFSGSSLIDMDAGDTCKIKVYQSGGTAQSDLGDGSATFSGYLVC